jgi:hypothetical protein
MIAIALLAPWLGTVDPQAGRADQRLKQPSEEFWFGSDMMGRDVYSRVLYGARVSLSIGIAVAILSTLLGLAIGLVTGYIRWLDAIVMRVMDGLMSIPPVLLAIALMALTRASMENVIAAITLAEVPRVTRLVRSLVLTLRDEPYVVAAIAAGTRLPRILRAPYPAEHRRAAARAGDLRVRVGDDHRGDPVVHRRGHAAQHPELGQHHGRGAEPVPDRGLSDLLSGRVPLAHGARDQPARRRHARRARPASRAQNVKR